MSQARLAYGCYPRRPGFGAHVVPSGYPIRGAQVGEKNGGRASNASRLPTQSQPQLHERTEACQLPLRKWLGWKKSPLPSGTVPCHPGHAKKVWQCVLADCAKKRKEGGGGRATVTITPACQLPLRSGTEKKRKGGGNKGMGKAPAKGTFGAEGQLPTATPNPCEGGPATLLRWRRPN